MKESSGKPPICILGGTGFIGRNLVKAIEEDASIKVKIISKNERTVVPFPNNIRVEKGDLLNLDSLVDFLEPNATVINLAFLRNQSVEHNIRATMNLAKACSLVDVARLIHCSSADVVGRVTDDVITEETICSEVEPCIGMGANQEWGVPVPAQWFLARSRLGLDVNRLTTLLVKTYKTAVLRLGVQNIRVFRVHLCFESISAFRHKPVGVSDSISVRSPRWSAKSVVVLGTTVNVVERELIIGADSIKLRYR